MGKNRHYIYHVRGVKVGVTTNIKHRRYLYRRDHGEKYELEVLDVLENKSDEEVGNIEWQWADKLGYPRGTHYRNVKAKFHGQDRKENP